MRWPDRWISLKLFLEIVIKRNLIHWTSPNLNLLLGTSSSFRASVSKQNSQNNVLATVELSLDNTKQKLRISPETNFLLIQAFNWFKNNLSEIHISQRLGLSVSLSVPLIILQWIIFLAFMWSDQNSFHFCALRFAWYGIITNESLVSKWCMGLFIITV